MVFTMADAEELWRFGCCKTGLNRCVDYCFIMTCES